MIFKKKIFIKTIVILLLFSNVSNAQNDWKEIDERPFPAWWTDAKFGVFIHWGPYAVPAFSKLGEYSEWYWKDLVDTTRVSHKEVKEFHNKNFGEGFAYQDFISKYKAELFDANQWADILSASGAKYVVLTSKHHDGYTLWPNEQANKSWGRPYNSTNSGPQRDIVGELSEAVRAKNIKMGLYYSLYEWYNPLYTTNVDVFVKEHLVPQFKDVVTKYKPSIIFSDGEWEHPYTTWKSTEMLSWLFNESAVKDEVVINDRWGKNMRHKHGGYFTTEYGSGMPNSNHPWEENRGMAYSFGFSRTENLADYNSSQEFIYMLIDIVSRGGNFLLDIGPSADGTIPVIMQERLKDIGDWLKVNGEAIYDTKTYERDCQWSKGEIRDSERGEYKVPYDILKLTINPDKGFAVKEFFFTKKGTSLYAISPRLPMKDFLIKNIKTEKNAKISMLGHKENLQWTQTKEGILVSMPNLDFNNLKCKHAFTFKISNVKF